MKFDVVIGNPPFQLNNKSGTESLWKKFVKLSIEKCLKEGGYLCFITPTGWLSDNKVRKYFIHKKVIYANLKSNIKEFFKGIGSTFSWFIIKNSKGNDILPLDLDEGPIDVNLKEMDVFPERDINKISLSIFKKLRIDAKKMGVINDNNYRIKSDTKTEEFKYPAFYTVSQPLVYTKMPRYLKDKKVIFSECSSFKPFYDDGTIGAVWHACHIPVKNEQEGKNLLKYLNSKLIKYYEYIGRQGGWNILGHHIPDIDLSKSWTDEEIFDNFNLSEEEKQYIRTLRMNKPKG